MYVSMHRVTYLIGNLRFTYNKLGNNERVIVHKHSPTSLHKDTESK